MTKYVLKRLLHGLISSIIVVGIVMVMIYTMLDRNLIFAQDPVFKNLGNNEKTAYMYRTWEEYGYIDLFSYQDYLLMLQENGEIDEETRKSVSTIGRKPESDKPETAAYIQKYQDYCDANGYTVVRLNAVMVSPKKYANGGKEQLFASKDLPIAHRLITYVTGFFSVDNIHYVDKDIDIGERKLTFTLHDPVYGGNKFAPAIIGNGTYHKYLLYVDDKFPFIHQNVLTINLGKSYAVNAGVDVSETMVKKQGSYVLRSITFPTGLTEESADDLHTAVFVANSRETNKVNADRFTDDYTGVNTVKSGKSKMGYSFTIGIIAVFLSYLIGIPMGIAMAKNKDKLIDKIGTVYIVFIIAVPSLAYIFLFKAIGGKLGLPTTFDMESSSKLIYVLPIISLSLQSIGALMRWLRRYMIDQMNSDYVKFARSGGLTEGEIFRKHILKNASIPIVHGIPGGILGALVGAIVTERVYTVPGAGNLLTVAISMYDNGVIVGVTLFYALLSVISLVMGDVLISIVDPRINYSGKAR
ncbi:ABC transporter permease [Butyrivibrio sp. YAB3001]|uniref:ABC transporter permease n=1 Tax=Butyrivibrio sp. YAB3001 TaxID=1520812 RepID=UPI0008F655DE|nr:ABC transporter permease [Butyrivibrio sp. YAB3001]SFD01575.1 oligopeptide transport system permease protein [Butyrivibrio sp. YAB3001]